MRSGTRESRPEDSECLRERMNLARGAVNVGRGQAKSRSRTSTQQVVLVLARNVRDRCDELILWISIPQTFCSNTKAFARFR